MRTKHFLFVAETSQLMARTPGHMAVPRHQPCKFVKLRNCGPARILFCNGTKYFSVPYENISCHKDTICGSETRL